MKIEELMETDVSSLAKKQHEYLKQHAIDRLSIVISLLEMDDYKGLEKLIIHSPAGDGMGCNNDYIDMWYGDDKTYSIDGYDIGSVISHLETLKKSI